jgi:N-acetylglucosamine-6-sulfatase
MRRRQFLKAVAAGGVAAGSLSASGLRSPRVWAAARPNVVVIMTDDQAVSQMSALATVRNQIMSQGVTFDRAIDPIPLCCPARASFLTGQYPHNHGVLANNGTKGGYAALDQTNTIARWMHDAGYRTAHIGKYMNGYNRFRARPTGWDEWWATSKNPFLMWDYTLNHNGQEVHYGYASADYKTDVLTGLALAFIQSMQGSPQPLYLNLWYTAPHAEQGTDSRGVTYNQAPRPAPRHVGAFASAALPNDPSIGEADVSDKPAWVRALSPIGTSRRATLTQRYRTELASLLSVDEGVAKVITALTNAGRLANTILIFMSDNGYTHGEHRVAAQKVVVYEPSLLVPLCVRGPGFAPGTRVGTPVSAIDLAPTLVQAAGTTAGRTIDGRPLSDAMSGAIGPDRAILVASGTDTTPDRQYIGVHTNRWTYTELLTKEKEVYDLATDPYQLTNIAGEPSVVNQQAALKNLLTALRTAKGAACNVAVPPILA